MEPSFYVRLERSGITRDNQGSCRRTGRWSDDYHSFAGGGSCHRGRFVVGHEVHHHSGGSVNFECPQRHAATRDNVNVDGQVAGNGPHHEGAFGEDTVE